MSRKIVQCLNIFFNTKFIILGFVVGISHRGYSFHKCLFAFASCFYNINQVTIMIMILPIMKLSEEETSFMNGLFLQDRSNLVCRHRKY